MDKKSTTSKRRAHGPIGMADALHALHHLDPKNQQQVDQIFACLRLDPAIIKNSKQNRPKPAGAQRDTHKPQRADLQGPRINKGRGLPPAPSPRQLEGDELPLSVEITKQAAANPGFEPTEKSPTLTNTTKTLPRHLPFFPAQKSRGLLSAMIAQPSKGSVIDTQRIIQSAIKMRPLKELPYLSEFSIRNGVQLLLDFSDAMTPWYRDLKILTQQILALAGDSAVTVFEFEHNPNEAIRYNASGQPVPWKPKRHQPVLVASDFSMLGKLYGLERPPIEDWNQLAKTCRRKQCQVLALSPIKSLPEELDTAFKSVYWHANTTATDIRQLARLDRT